MFTVHDILSLFLMSSRTLVVFIDILLKFLHIECLDIPLIFQPSLGCCERHVLLDLKKSDVVDIRRSENKWDLTIHGTTYDA